MPGCACAIATCKSSGYQMKKQHISISFHQFPRETNLVLSTIRQEWIRRCRRNDKFNPNKSRICSLHFKSNDYQRDLRNELLGLPLRKLLKKTAIPTLNLNDGSESDTKNFLNETPRSTRTKRRSNKQVVQTIVLEAAKKEETIQEEIVEIMDMKESLCLDVPSISMKPEKDESNTLYCADPDYKQKYKDLLLKFNKFKSNSKAKVSRLSKMVKYYKMKLYNHSLKNLVKIHYYNFQGNKFKKDLKRKCLEDNNRS